MDGTRDVGEVFNRALNRRPTDAVFAVLFAMDGIENIPDLFVGECDVHLSRLRFHVVRLPERHGARHGRVVSFQVLDLFGDGRHKDGSQISMLR